ncbi:GNAT family N-acetyltransferase [Lysinibacillus macroides]|uniref:GNAT family N-acetyltransferase n=1 Tax=Lysinibacillus macroides TaxID=33935 RepID=UPI000A63B8D8|nr:GNAT family N-acetyltransferase [Lysinibacillus macroides]
MKRKGIFLQLIRIRTDDELMWYKEIWDDMLEQEDNDNPFIEFAWFYNWWQMLGRKERVELYAVEHKGMIIAFFPFTVAIRWGIRVYTFAGEDIAYYTGIIAKKEWFMQATTFVFDELRRKHQHIIFSLHGLLESKQSTTTIEQYFVEKQLPAHIFRIVTPYLALSEQQQNVHTIDQQASKLRNLGLLTKHMPLQDELWQMFRLFDRQQRKRVGTSGFIRGKNREFFERLAMLQGEALEVKIHALLFENQWIACTYGLCCRGRYITYARAYEPLFHIFGVERMANQETIQRAYAANYRLLDMGIGYEPYKLEWRSGVDFTRNMLASSGTKRTKLLAGFLTLKERLKNFAKGSQHWQQPLLGQLRLLVKYGKVKDWLEYGQQFVERFIRLQQVTLYELSPSEAIAPQQPVGNLFMEMSIQEAMQLEQKELMDLFYKGYTLYKDPFAETNKLAFALHASHWHMDTLQITEALPKQTCFLSHDDATQIDIITAYFRHSKPTQALWITAGFWQWRKRKRLIQLGYQPISRIKHYKMAYYKRHHVEKYTESGGDVHSVH